MYAGALQGLKDARAYDESQQRLDLARQQIGQQLAAGQQDMQQNAAMFPLKQQALQLGIQQNQQQIQQGAAEAPLRLKNLGLQQQAHESALAGEKQRQATGAIEQELMSLNLKKAQGELTAREAQRLSMGSGLARIAIAAMNEDDPEKVRAELNPELQSASWQTIPGGMRVIRPDGKYRDYVGNEYKALLNFGGVKVPYEKPPDNKPKALPNLGDAGKAMLKAVRDVGRGPLPEAYGWLDTTQYDARQLADAIAASGDFTLPETATLSPKLLDRPAAVSAFNAAKERGALKKALNLGAPATNPEPAPAPRPTSTARSGAGPQANAAGVGRTLLSALQAPSGSPGDLASVLTSAGIKFSNAAVAKDQIVQAIKAAMANDENGEKAKAFLRDLQANLPQ